MALHSAMAKCIGYAHFCHVVKHVSLKNLMHGVESKFTSGGYITLVS